MNTNNRIFQLFATFVLCCVSITTVNAQSQTINFSDVDDTNKFRDHIYALANDEVIAGYPDGTYRPSSQVTREQLAKFVRKGFGLELTENERNSCTQFVDVSGENKFADDIFVLKCKNIINGFGDGTFRGGDVVTREQTTKFVVAAILKKNPERFSIVRDIQLFPDVNYENKFYDTIDMLSSVELQDQSRIMQGYTGGEFGGGNAIDRGQIAKIVNQGRRYQNDGGRYNPPLAKFINDFGQEVTDGTILDSTDYNILASYTAGISENKLVLFNTPNTPTNEFERHQRILDSFASIAPRSVFDEIVTFELLANHPTLGAAVSRDFEHDEKKFRLYVNTDFLEGDKIFPTTIIHESAHILTINSDQLFVDPVLLEADSEEQLMQMIEEQEQNCTTIFVGLGCAKSSSYITDYYRSFWEPKLEEDQTLKDFYLKYNNEFVSTYSLFAPEEDMAEAFTYFVIYEKPKDNVSIVNQKINFFYDIDEFVEIRDEVRTKLAQQNQ